MENNLLVSVLTATLNKPVDEIQGLLFEEVKKENGEVEKSLKADADQIAIKQINEWYAGVDTRNKEKLRTIANDKYGQGLKEGASKYERLIAEATGFKSDELKGEEFVREALSHVTANKGSTDFKTNPEFLKYEADLRKQWEAKLNELKTGFEQKETTWQKENMWSNKIAPRIMAKIQAMNPLPLKNLEAEQNRLNYVLEYFKSHEFADNNNDSFVISKNGERIEEMGTAVSFDKFIETHAKKFFDFPVQGEKKTASAGDDAGKNTQVKICATPAEYRQAFAECKTPEDRIALMKAHEGKF